MRKLHLLLLLLLLPSISFSQLPTTGGTAAAPDDWLLGQGQKWHHRTVPANEPATLFARMPNSAEERVIERAKEIIKKSSAKSLMLMKGNEVVWSGYREPANDSSFFFSFSIGKTVTSMAIGQAICAGKLSLQDKAEKWVTEIAGTDLGSATVQQLLKMSSGTSAINPDSTIMSSNQDSDLRSGKISFVDILKNPGITKAKQASFGGKSKPGVAFDYHSTDPLLLGVILNRATGTTYAKWTEEMVFKSAGLKYQAIVGQDHFGYGQADGNMRMKLEDWGRFALWVKNAESATGCFSDYVRDASKTQIKNSPKREGKAFDAYGYLIWTENNRQQNSYWAVGYGGQRIAWNHKNKRMLVAFSNLEDYMDDVYTLYRDWAALPD